MEHVMGKTCSMNGGEEGWIQDTGGKARKKKSTRNPRLWQMDNVKMELKELGWSGVDQIEVAHCRDQWKAL